MSDGSPGQAFETWALVELMGHRRMAGKVSEQTIAGAGTIRVDVFVGDAPEPAVTQFYGGGSIYCLTPISETTARTFARQNIPTPISSWEMQSIEAAAGNGDDEYDGPRLRYG